jgi:hypothetical protein
MAQMLYGVARGNIELLTYYGLQENLEKKGFFRLITGRSRKKYNVIWVDGFGRPLDDVMRAILSKRRDKMHGQGLLSYLPSPLSTVI